MQCDGASKRSLGYVKRTRQPDRNSSGTPDPRRQAARPEALIDAYLDHIAHRDPAVRAFAHFDPAEARAAAAKARPGPLQGIPIGVKDVLDTADMPSQYGSPIWANRQPKADSAPVAWARDGRRRRHRQNRHYRVRHAQAWPDHEPGQPGPHPGRIVLGVRRWRRRQACSRSPTAPKPPAASSARPPTAAWSATNPPTA